MNRFLSALSIIVFLGAEGISLAQEAAPQGLKISGFVNALYETSVTGETSTFAMDQAELDVSKEGQSSGFVVNLNWIKGQGGGADEAVEQGFAWIGLGQNMRLAMGKFNAPIGFESVDPVDMYQISHSMVYAYGLPKNLTGLKFSMGAGILDLTAYVVNGWDQMIDDNKDKTFGARAGLNFSRGFVLGVSLITGQEGLDRTEGGGLNAPTPAKLKTNNLTVIDLDFTVTAGGSTTMGGDLNFGMFEKQSAVKPGGDASWLAFMLMLNQKITDKFALTGRYDYFNDNGGARLGFGKKESRHAFTLCGDYLAAENFRILGEFQFVLSSEKAFVSGSGKNVSNDMILAGEALYSF